MQAALPMYDFPEVRPALRALWEQMRPPDGPALCHPTDLDAHYRRPDLLFSQICGMEVFAGRFEGALVGMPHHETSDVQGPYYRSRVVVRSGEIDALSKLRGGRLAVNNRYSFSGCVSIIPMIAELTDGADFFSEIIDTGAHEASMRLVAAGGADVAAIDCVTYAILDAQRPSVTRPLDTLALTELGPPPPYISRHPDALGGVDATRIGPHPELCVTGASTVEKSRYDAIGEFIEAGKRRSYLQLIPVALR